MRFSLFVLALLLAALPARAFDTKATSAWVYDVTTHTVLMDKNGEVALPPASMSKLMTVNMLFEALRDGRVTMDTTFAVSARATEMTRRNASTMYLQESDTPTVRDLIMGIIVNSGGDACIVVAEGLAGTDEAFAAQMTERGRAIGLEHSTFANSSGWPDPKHRMSLKDIALVSLRLIEEFPEYYPYFAETEFNYKNRAPANANNRNPLLDMGIGADGLKTGHTIEAGFGLAASVKQGDRRIVFVISGLATDADRSEESRKVADWAFRQFALKTVVKAGVRVAEAQVFMGAEDTVGLVPASDVKLLVPASVQDGVTAEVVYTGPLSAPIAKGAQVAELVIRIPELPESRVPLLAENDVAKGGFVNRLGTAVGHLRTRYLGEAPAS